ncbi:hypothetical protein [Winogradskyella sp.]
MKNLLNLSIFVFLFIMFSTCSVNDIEDDSDLNVNENETCLDSDPITRVVNNGTSTYHLKVVDTDGVVLVDIPNIPPNTTTSWASFAPGEVLFSLDANQTMVNDDKVVLQMNTCMAYDIEIAPDNTIVSYTPTIL